jgi:hypothetical protein
VGLWDLPWLHGKGASRLSHATTLIPKEPVKFTWCVIKTLVESDCIYTMKRRAGFIFWISIVLGLNSCYLPVSLTPSKSEEEVRQYYGTVSVILTETGAVSPVPTQTLTVTPISSTTPTESPLPAVEQSPTIDVTATITPSPKAELNTAASLRCDLAQPGRPFDISVADESHFYPGESFSKTWRLINAGSCEWTHEYSVVWFSGEDLGVNPVQTFGTNVLPGQVIDISVDMVAPLVPGTYQSNWKFRNSQGDLFGIGPNGDAPFWARIVVVPVDTPTVTPPVPTPTPTQAVFAAGSLQLALDDHFDLDTGALNLGEKDDFIFARNEEKHLSLQPTTETRAALFGMAVPSLEDCLLVEIHNTAVDLEQLPAGAFLCYRTHEGLPGWLSVTKLDIENGGLSLDFLTWGIP